MLNPAVTMATVTMTGKNTVFNIVMNSVSFLRCFFKTMKSN